MRKHIKLPAPQLSQLKEVDIDLDMTGRHYAILATCEGQVPEDVVLSILKDLLEQDANKLTLSELRYLFILVKINSLENEYTVPVKCTHTNDDGTDCGCINQYKIFLSDADLNPTSNDYIPPKIHFRTTDTEKEYFVIPPTMDIESNIWNFFQTQRNASSEKIVKDKKLSFEYTLLRSICHLVDGDGNRLISTYSNFEDILKLADSNKYQTINHLFDYVIEVGKYGVQDKVYEVKCKKCKKKLIFQLPLLHGLLD